MCIKFSVDFDKMEFSYPCGLSECKYPSHYCESDSDLLSRSRCLPCSEDICSMLGTEHFPKACTFHCNPKEALIDVCTRNFKEDQGTSIPMFCQSGLLFISVALNILLVITFCYLIWRQRKKMVICLLSWKNKEKEKHCEQTDSNKQTNQKDEEKDNLLKEQTGNSGIHQPYDEQSPAPINMRSLHCIIPATADNNPARNLVVPSTNRGMMESQMTDMQNVLTTTVKGLES